MDHRTAQDWLDRYLEAWLTYDPALIGDLFSEDVAYRYHPYDDPLVGRDAVVEAWLGRTSDSRVSTRDEPGTYEASYTPIAVDGDVVVATGTSSYRDAPGGPVTTVFDNCFVIRFDADGRAREFTDYYMERPAAQ